MTNEPTQKQKQILDFIARVQENVGWPPALREIAREFKISLGSVQDRIAALEAKGYLSREKGQARGLALAAKSMRPYEIPILGRVGAGSGMIAQEYVEGHVRFRDFLLGTDFLLRVKGDSMIDEGILEGDLVQVRRQPMADDGDIVVALVGEEGVVKRLRRVARTYQLESANPNYRPIVMDFQVIGKVVGLVRRYER